MYASVTIANASKIPRSIHTLSRSSMNLLNSVGSDLRYKIHVFLYIDTLSHLLDYLRYLVFSFSVSSECSVSFCLLLNCNSQNKKHSVFFNLCFFISLIASAVE